jgi:putative SOS response-associated peptidase YedK
MCGRIVQKGDLNDYLERVIRAPKAGELFPPDTVGSRYNIPPGTRPLTLHPFQEGTIQLERIYWGYRPQNWKRKDISNAKIETIAAGKWPWNWLMKEGGRIIVPANGWYEWKWLTDDPKGPKQPYYIYHANGEPLLFAAVTAWRPGRAHGKENGMAIVTNDARGGMVDVHDRRPVALPPDLALEWLDPETTPARAAAILALGLPESAFTWHKVRREVGNSRYELPDAIEPINEGE